MAFPKYMLKMGLAEVFGWQELVRNLLDVWAAEMGDKSLRKEA